MWGSSPRVSGISGVSEQPRVFRAEAPVIDSVKVTGVAGSTASADTAGVRSAQQSAEATRALLAQQYQPDRFSLNTSPRNLSLQQYQHLQEDGESPYFL